MLDPRLSYSCSPCLCLLFDRSVGSLARVVDDLDPFSNDDASPISHTLVASPRPLGEQRPRPHSVSLLMKEVHVDVIRASKRSVVGLANFVDKGLNDLAACQQRGLMYNVVRERGKRTRFNYSGFT